MALTTLWSPESTAHSSVGYTATERQMNSIQGCWSWMKIVFHLFGLLMLLSTAPLARSATLTVQPRVGEPAMTVVVSGRGMAAFEEVILRYDGATLATAHTDASGSFKRGDVEIPGSALPGRRAIAAVGRSSGIRVTVPFLVRTNWPQFHHGPFRHGATPHENLLSADNVAQLKLLWSVPTGLYVNLALQGSPVVANGVVYMLTSSYEQGRLLALDAATGAQRWAQPIGSSYGCGATPTVAQGRVYAPGSGRLVAYDARSGAVQWRVGKFVICGPISTPTIVDGKMFTVTNGSPVLEARDADSGRTLWRRSVCISSPASSCTSASSSGPLAAGDGTIYVTNYVGGMAAYAADSGRQLWSRFVGSGLIDAAPVVEGDVVYVSVNDSRLYALNRHTGAQLWAAPTGDYNHSTPALADGVLYVGSDGNGVTAIDAKTGAVRWQQSALGVVRSSPAVANGVLYVTAGDGRLYALDARNGTVLYSRQIAPVGRYLSPSPAIADGVVYVGTGDRLLAFGLKLGMVNESP